MFYKRSCLLISLLVSFLLPHTLCFSVSNFDRELDDLLKNLSEQGGGEKPRYVLTMLSADPYPDDDGESEGESDPEFSDEESFRQASTAIREGRWNDLPFTMQLEKSFRAEEVSHNATVNPRYQEMAQRIAEEAFATHPGDSPRMAAERMRVVVLANRPCSLSRHRRYSPMPLLGMPDASVKKEAKNQPAQTHPLLPAITELHYHLRPLWEGKRGAGRARKRNAELSLFSQAEQWFRAFKKWESCQGIGLHTDQSMARRFRRHYEGDEFRRNIRGLVPFHSLRNELKNHRATRHAVEIFERERSRPDIYLTIFDDDFGPLRQHGIGLFSIYDALVAADRAQGRGAPTIMTTGYQLVEEGFPAIGRIASEIDRWVRAATARIIPNGVCFPEPNFLVKIPSPTSSRPSLVRPSPVRKVFKADFNKKKNGKSQTETRDFIKALYESGEASPETTRFLPLCPIATRPSKEMLSEAHKQFETIDPKSKRVKGWNEKTFTFLREFPQSHLRVRSWAQGIVAALECVKELQPENFNLPEGTAPFKSKGKGNIDHIAKSAVSRMMNAYHPLTSHTLKDLPRDAENFPQSVSQLLLRYPGHFPALPAPEVQPGHSLYDNYLRQVKSVRKLDDLRRMLAGLFVGGEETARRIENAAKEAGMAIRDGVLYYFDFGQMDKEMIHPLRQENPYFLPHCMEYDYSDRDVHNLLRSYINSSNLPHAYEGEGIDEHQFVRLTHGDGTIFVTPPIHYHFESATPTQDLQDYLTNQILPAAQDRPSYRVLVPYNLGNHWVTLVIDVNVEARGSSSITYLDSLDPDEVIVQETEEALTTLFPGATFNVAIPSGQTDRHACGPIMIENILDTLGLRERERLSSVMTPDLTLNLRRSHIEMLRHNGQALELDIPEAGALKSAQQKEEKDSKGKGREEERSDDIPTSSRRGAERGKLISSLKEEKKPSTSSGNRPLPPSNAQRPSLIGQGKGGAPRPVMRPTSNAQRPSLIDQGKVEVSRPVMRPTSNAQRPSLIDQGKVEASRPVMRTTSNTQRPSLIGQGKVEGSRPMRPTSNAQRPSLIGQGKVEAPRPVMRPTSNAQRPSLIGQGKGGAPRPVMRPPSNIQRPSLIGQGKVEAPRSVMRPSLILKPGRSHIEMLRHNGQALELGIPEAGALKSVQQKEEKDSKGKGKKEERSADIPTSSRRGAERGKLPFNLKEETKPSTSSGNRPLPPSNAQRPSLIDQGKVGAPRPVMRPSLLLNPRRSHIEMLRHNGQVGIPEAGALKSAQQKEEKDSKGKGKEEERSDDIPTSSRRGAERGKLLSNLKEEKKPSTSSSNRPLPPLPASFSETPERVATIVKVLTERGRAVRDELIELFELSDGTLRLVTLEKYITLIKQSKQSPSTLVGIRQKIWQRSSELTLEEVQRRLPLNPDVLLTRAPKEKELKAQNIVMSYLLSHGVTLLSFFWYLGYFDASLKR